MLAKEVGASLSVGADILNRRLFPSEPVGAGQSECGCTQSQLVLTIVNKNFDTKQTFVVFPFRGFHVKNSVSLNFCLLVFLNKIFFYN